MRSRLLISALAASCVAVSAAALAQGSAHPPSPAPMPAQGPAHGYLAAGAVPDTLNILPPPPKAGSAHEADDRAVFAATRALNGQPRWSLALSDANLAQGADLYSCALGAKLDSHTAPVLTAIFRKVGIDTIGVIDPPKDHYGRARPYTERDAVNAPVCVPKSEGLTKNPSYPSGHASISWTWGLILAELAPDRSTQILARARSIGDSRVVCGVHYRSDIEAGRMTGASLVAALHGDAAFRSDMDRARAELAALRSGPHATPTDCAVQDAAADHPPY